MFLVDTEQGRIIEDEEIKGKISTERPYRQWLNEHLVHLSDIPDAPEVPLPDHQTLLQRQIAFGYTNEDERIILTPMARDGVEAVGSMGNDAALAVLSNRPRLLYDYFKQLFAQVTNPPIDCIREELDHRRRDAPRLRGQPAEPAALGVPPCRAQVAHPHQRGVREASAPEPAGTQGRGPVRSSSGSAAGRRASPSRSRSFPRWPGA